MAEAEALGEPGPLVDERERNRGNPSNKEIIKSDILEQLKTLQ